ncbi:Amt family ammonium transporter [Amaricoccus macauensis]|uniref:Ammonium transporter n=1 Tax=Amaricoccus macauensis TaxID=57001 RepID=A0A840SJN9_9RHOB|nr:ammonium transporter [Amaricoccus macauensis]MBB5221174.1 Amt family ammonium transporter [Amaricoccus macauensis]
MRMFPKLPWVALALLAAGPVFAQDTAAPEVVTEVASAIDSGDTAWMLTSTLLVLFMTIPGLALFYGGLVRSKNMLSVLMQVTLVASVVMILYVFYGYSMSFGGSDSPYWGGLGKVFLSGVTPDSASGTIPELVFAAFQMTFAAITPALIVGAFAERIRFSAVMLFTILWVTLVYFPIAHMAWDPAGLYFNWGAMDFAGGTVVHINAGIAALVGALVIGPRIGYRKEIMAPHSMTLTMVGTAILWVGWFGFNAGSALSAGGLASLAMMNTFVATAGAVVGWSVLEAVLRSKASMLGAASGAVAGLVAVTPAAGFVGPVGAIALGLIASACCYFFVNVVKEHLGYDDSLDVFGVHGVGGIVGAILTGVLASSTFGGVGYADGVTMGAQLLVQVKAVCVTIAWCGIVSLILYKLVDVLIGLRVTPEIEREGLDLAEHGERAYVY